MDARDITRLTDAFQAELEALNGGIWKAAFSELQMPYNEFAIWILLYEDSDLTEVHKTFQAVISPLLPRIEPLHAAVSYLLIADGIETQVDFLDTNAEIMEEGRILGDMPMVLGPAEGVFSGMDSRR